MKVLNIILCNDINDNIDIFKKENPYIYTGKPYILIDGNFFNPPFFKILIINDNLKINDYDIKILYNNVIIDGFFIIPYKYFHLFNNLKNETKKYKEYVMIKKKNNIIFHLKNRIIDCIICGVQKASTTSALKNLSKHPDISSYPEEIHYFDINWKKGVQFYEKHFDYSKKIIMEKTPDLLYLSHTFPLIQSLNPFVKLIIFLRNPIDRAYSAWNMSIENKWTTLTFEECIEEELTFRIGENKLFYPATNHYLQRGLYYKQIKKLLKFFPKQNIIILISEKIRDNMEKEYNKIYDFLNIPKLNNIDYTKERVGNYNEKIKKDTYDKLIIFFKEDVSKLEKFLGYGLDWF
jgi:hypothetical protein